MTEPPRAVGDPRHSDDRDDPNDRPERARVRRRALIAGGVLAAGAAGVILWPVDDDGVTPFAGDIRPDGPADYLLRLRRRVAPLRRPPRPTSTPAPRR